MRVTNLIGLGALLLLSACGFQGTVVRKDFRPLPFSGSLGVAGIYHLELRNQAGQVRDQMVTADAFANYEVGDYFEDQVPELASEDIPAESPTVSPLFLRRPLEEYGTHYRTMDFARVDTSAPHSQQVAGRAKSTRRIASAKSNTREIRRVTLAKHPRKHPLRIAPATPERKVFTKVARPATRKLVVVNPQTKTGLFAFLWSKISQPHRVAWTKRGPSLNPSPGVPGA